MPIFENPKKRYQRHENEVCRIVRNPRYRRTGISLRELRDRMPRETIITEEYLQGMCLKLTQEGRIDNPYPNQFFPPEEPGRIIPPEYQQQQRDSNTGSTGQSGLNLWQTNFFSQPNNQENPQENPSQTDSGTREDHPREQDDNGEGDRRTEDGGGNRPVFQEE